MFIQEEYAEPGAETGGAMLGCGGNDTDADVENQPLERGDGEKNREEVAALLNVARLYYLENRTQAQIAREIGYSRVSVSRLLAKARAMGIVRISIGHPLERVRHLEDELCLRLGLRNARIAQVVPGVSSTEAVGALAADFVANQIKKDTVIAISNGRSVAATVAKMPSLRCESACCVQMIGMVGNGSLPQDSPEMCMRLAKQIHAKQVLLPVPLVVSNPKLARQLMEEEKIIAALQLCQKSDIAITGIGNVATRGPVSPLMGEYVSSELMTMLEQTRVVAHLCGHHLDENGNHVKTPLCQYTTALRPEYLRNIKLTVGVAWGEEKVRAIRAVVRGKYINTLVTDSSTAQKLLELS